MKIARFFVSTLFLAGLVSSGCGAPEANAPGFENSALEQLHSANDTGRPVSLLYVKAASRCEYGSYSAYGRLYGYIEVENLAYEKQVVVHYLDRQSGNWRDIQAVFLQSLSDNKEVWYFESEEVGYSPRLSADFQFAIRYSVNGEEYWDNNAGKDYRISTGPRPLYPTDLVLGKSEVALRKANGHNSWTGNTLEGFVHLKNLAYDKAVKIVYTIDGWDSVNEGYASYGRPLSDNQEAWYFSIPLGGGYGQVMAVEFAICCEVNGIQIWDNNFYQNYSFDVPGSLE
ncbi:MAG: hypothetical protein JRJ87_21245 [Deltaproteobacteria bacterium]|nr:hypothetical protein [Deltaproteobacteria bacterium]